MPKCLKCKGLCCVSQDGKHLRRVHIAQYFHACLACDDGQSAAQFTADLQKALGEADARLGAGPVDALLCAEAKLVACRELAYRLDATQLSEAPPSLHVDLAWVASARKAARELLAILGAQP